MTIFDRFYWTCVAGFVALVATALASCDDPRDPNAPAAPPDPPAAQVQTGPRVRMLYENPSGVQNIWIDDETGCQYLGYKNDIGSIRYTKDGRPWCGISDVTR